MSRRHAIHYTESGLGVIQGGKRSPTPDERDYLEIAEGQRLEKRIRTICARLDARADEIEVRTAAREEA